MVVLPSTGAWR